MQTKRKEKNDLFLRSNILLLTFKKLYVFILCSSKLSTNIWLFAGSWDRKKERAGSKFLYDLFQDAWLQWANRNCYYLDKYRTPASKLAIFGSPLKKKVQRFDEKWKEGQTITYKYLLWVEK